MMHRSQLPQYPYDGYEDLIEAFNKECKYSYGKTFLAVEKGKSTFVGQRRFKKELKLNGYVVYEMSPINTKYDWSLLEKDQPECYLDLEPINHRQVRDYENEIIRFRVTDSPNLARLYEQISGFVANESKYIIVRLKE